MSGVRVPAPPPRPVPATRLRRIEPPIRRAFRGPCAEASGGRVLVAVSGGADSTALLLGLHRLRSELELDLAAAHLHHGLRGSDADADLAFVRSLCDRLGLPLIAARWNTAARMRRRGLSGHAGLRTLRRREFLARRGAAGARRVDRHGAHGGRSLDTLLMRLARGAGSWPGRMSPRRGPWLKPLLAATRAEVEAELVPMCQPWREDASNLDLSRLGAASGTS